MTMKQLYVALIDRAIKEKVSILVTNVKSVSVVNSDDKECLEKQIFRMTGSFLLKMLWTNSKYMKTKGIGQHISIHT